MLKFIVDTQLPPKLAKYLNSQSIDVIHTTFFPDGHLLTDTEIRNIAAKEVGNIKNDDLLGYFEQELSNILTLFENDAALVIFDRLQLIAY